MGGTDCVEGQEKEWMWCRLDDLKAFGNQWRLQLGTKGDDAGRRNKRRNISWRNGLLQCKPGLDYGMQS